MTNQNRKDGDAEWRWCYEADPFESWQSKAWQSRVPVHGHQDAQGIHKVPAHSRWVLLRARGNKMKQRVLALAIKRIVWAELALTAVLAPPAFAQSQPAPGAVAIADAVASGAPVTVAQAGGTTRRCTGRCGARCSTRCSSRRDACRTRRERAGQGRADQAVRSDAADPAGRQDGFPAGADDHAEGNPGQRRGDRRRLPARCGSQLGEQLGRRAIGQLRGRRGRHCTARPLGEVHARVGRRPARRAVCILLEQRRFVLRPQHDPAQRHRADRNRERARCRSTVRTRSAVSSTSSRNTISAACSSTAASAARSTPATVTAR